MSKLEIETLKTGDLIMQSELAQMIGKSRQAVNDMVKRGQLNINGKMIIFDDTCKEYINKSNRRGK